VIAQWIPEKTELGRAEGGVPEAVECGRQVEIGPARRRRTVPLPDKELPKTAFAPKVGP